MPVKRSPVNYDLLIGCVTAPVSVDSQMSLIQSNLFIMALYLAFTPYQAASFALTNVDLLPEWPPLLSACSCGHPVAELCLSFVVNFTRV